jgi:transposase
MFLKKATRKGIDYYLIAENYREGIKIKSRQLAYVGRIDDPDKVARIKKKLAQGFFIENYHSIKDLHHGNVACLLEVAEKYNLIEQIDSHVKKEDGLKMGLTTILLAINRLIDPVPKMGFQDWILTTSLPRITDVQTDMLICENLCHMLDYLDMETRIAIDITRTSATPQIDMKKGFHYDITSTYTYGHCNPKAKHGYSRDHRPDLEQVTWGLLTDINQIPITCHVEPGNSSDMTLFPQVMKDLIVTFGLKDITVVVDRGMVSEDNVNEVVDQLGLGLICMLKKSELAVQDAIDEARKKKLHVLKTGKGEEGGKLKVEVEGISMVKELYGKHRKVVVCYNPESDRTQTSKRREKLARVEVELADLKAKLDVRSRKYEHVVTTVDKILKGLKDYLNWEVVSSRTYNSFDFELVKPATMKKDRKRLERLKEAMRKYRETLVGRKTKASREFLEKKVAKILGTDAPRFRITIEEVGVRPTIRWWQDDKTREALRRAEELDGWYALMASDLDATAEDIVAAYHGKDGIEKCFRSIKGVIHVQPVNHHKDNRVDAHIWICMVAHYIRRMFELELKENKIDLTFEEAMKQLKSVNWNVNEMEVIEGISIEFNDMTKLNETQQKLIGVFELNPIPLYC